MNTSQLFATARKVVAEHTPYTASKLSQRLTCITKLKEVILADREHLMDALQKETGKCRSDALMSEIFPILDHLHYLEKNALKILTPRTVATPLALMGKKSRIYFDPLGVVLVISPWNYPLFQAVVPCTAAYITGNSVIYKPSEHTPLKGIFEDLLQKAGFEPGAIQVAYGDGAAGSALIEAHPNKIFFTGSVATGKKIMEQAARQLIPVELELGGKDPMIVFEDANLKRAASGAVWGALTNCGQSCTSVERVYVHESVYPEFRKLVLEEVSRVKQTVDADGDSDVGRMTVDLQVQTVAEHLRDAKTRGATVLAGAQWDGANRNIPPLVIENLRDDMPLVTEETFGPVIPLLTFQTEDEVVVRANNSRYGLSASIWTADAVRAERVARRLATGNVSINNVMLTEANPALPFGGVKDSGMGRYKGDFGLYTFCNIKSVIIDKNSAKIEANWYPYTKEKYKLFTDMMVGLFSGGPGGFLKFALSGMKLESYSQKAKRGGSGNGADHGSKPLNSTSVPQEIHR